MLICIGGLAIAGSIGLRALAGENNEKPAQTSQPTGVPSGSYPREAEAGQNRILEIEYSCKTSDVALNEEKFRQIMRSDKGGVYSQQVVDGDIKSLYQTGDYTNVEIVVSQVTVDGEEGVRLSVIIDPRLRVSVVEVKRKRADGGLDDELSVDKHDLLGLKIKTVRASDAEGVAVVENEITPKETVTKAGDTLSEERMQRDAFAMEDFYRDKGYKDVKIRYKEVDVKGEESKVVFEIEEGMQGFISKTRFLGNKEVREGDLDDVLQLKPASMLSSKQTCLNDELLRDDVNKVRYLYQNKGFQDVQVTTSVDSIPNIKNQWADKKGSAHGGSGKAPQDIIITYQIEEGRQYWVGTISVKGNTYFSPEDLINELTTNSKKVEIINPVDLRPFNADGLQENEVYAVSSLQASIETLKKKYGRRGFINALIQFRTVPNVDSGRIDVEFEIKEGERIYVDKIEIYGNTVTMDRVIRREIEFAPGEIWDTELEKLSKRKLEMLKLFSSVVIYAEDTDRGNRMKLVVIVREKNEQKR
jgi:outer membrane protein assembly factor BamA